MKFSIILPCYNEAGNLQQLALDSKKLARKFDVEFIFVENGSKDSSRDILKTSPEFADDHFRIVYVEKNLGYGYGIVQGIKIASGDYIGWMHADGQYKLGDLRLFFDFLLLHKSKRYFVKGKRSGRSLTDTVFSFGQGCFSSLLFQRRMKEVMSSPTIGHKSLFVDTKSFPFDFSIDIYVYALAFAYKMPVVHIPIMVHARQQGKSSWKSGLLSKLRMSRDLALATVWIRCIFPKLGA